MWKYFSFFLLFSPAISAQYTWQWTELASMPFATTNNAVCEAFVDAERFVYSFGGLDSTKMYSGIHRRSFKFSLQTGLWSEIAPLPDTLGKIASAASFVNGKIYILGGYHVLANGSEISSNRVHIYDPLTDQFEGNGAPIPLAIDDHVQCVYKDSLIFVITGWSNSGNVTNVQIYNTYTDTWQIGTPTPDNLYFKAFGASGVILGDSIYYHGGAAGGAFTARNYLRKGFIDPSDPTLITWMTTESAPGLPGYRSACSGRGNTAFWLGGSSKAYNYNGIAYDGTGGVDPSARILHWNNEALEYADQDSQPFGVMDLRGIASIGNNQWIICGGMDSNQTVQNRTFLLENSLLNEHDLIFPNWQVYNGETEIIVKSSIFSAATLVSSEGRIIIEFKDNDEFVIDKNWLSRGMYFLNQGKSSFKIIR